jgi:hypothetical protein
MSELMEALPWNRLRFASLVSVSCPPKYASLLMLLALPNFLTASSPAGPLEAGGGVLLGLRREE